MGNTSEYNRLYYQQNKAKLRVKNKRTYEKWKQDHPTSYRKYKQKWDAARRQDPVFRIGENMRGNMHHALKAKKAGRKWEDLVGYTLQDLLNHITPLLKDGMTWENYGEVWHIDHVTPKSWFKYDSVNDEQFKDCWALTNLQPLLATDNRKKKNSFSG